MPRVRAAAASLLASLKSGIKAIKCMGGMNNQTLPSDPVGNVVIEDLDDLDGEQNSVPDYGLLPDICKVDVVEAAENIKKQVWLDSM